MKVNLDADEVIKIAVSIEINGENNYREAAAKATDLKLADLFNELADMEKDHARYFSSMLKSGQLNNEELVEVADEDRAKKIADMISKEIFGQLPTKVDDLKAMFEYALTTENLTIEFYTTLKEVFPKLIKESEIDLIIEEEENHVSSILNAMGEYFYSE